MTRTLLLLCLLLAAPSVAWACPPPEAVTLHVSNPELNNADFQVSLSVAEPGQAPRAPWAVGRFDIPQGNWEEFGAVEHAPWGSVLTLTATLWDWESPTPSQATYAFLVRGDATDCYVSNSAAPPAPPLIQCYPRRME